MIIRVEVRNRFKGLDLIECLKNYGRRFITLHRRQWSKPSSRKRKEERQNGSGGGEVLRWQRNRMGRPLSPSQIHQKNISTLSKRHETTSECWQRTSGTQKSRSLTSKTGRKRYKRWKKRQRRWGGSSILGRESHPRKGSLRREVSKHQETLSLPSLCWKHRGQHNRKEK